jgi:bifunctional non-homologous end joining protein LigD
MRDIPVTYVIFDLLWLEGHSTLGLAYRDRRTLLAELELSGKSWRVPAHREGDGAALLEATSAQGLEGVVAKRLDSPYEPGRRSSAWIKIKNRPSQEVVVGGWLPGEGRREATLGALTVGVHDGGRLVYAGRVGSGFTEETLATTMRELEPLRRDDSPFEGRQPPKGTIFVKPRLVAQVEFAEWTATGTLRAPSFKGLRPDADPAAVVREG